VILLSLPPFPKVSEERTRYGFCLRQAFTIGEWQDKAFRNAKDGNWYLARENVEGIIKIEEYLRENCGVDTRRPIFYAQRILEAIDKKDWRSVEETISQHDTEILASLETAKPPIFFRLR